MKILMNFIEVKLFEKTLKVIKKRKSEIELGQILAIYCLFYCYVQQKLQKDVIVKMKCQIPQFHRGRGFYCRNEGSRTLSPRTLHAQKNWHKFSADWKNLTAFHIVHGKNWVVCSCSEKYKYREKSKIDNCSFPVFRTPAQLTICRKPLVS